MDGRKRLSQKPLPGCWEGDRMRRNVGGGVREDEGGGGGVEGRKRRGKGDRECGRGEGWRDRG